MTTLNSFDAFRPADHEVSDASLAMADFDAKGGDYATALDWLAVAAQHRQLTPEYHAKRSAWEFSLQLS